MPRRNRPKSAKAVVKKVMNAKQHEWMKQEGLKQEVVTLHAPFLIVQPTIGGSSSYTNTLYANANGFGTYNSAGALINDSMPQRGIWDTYAKMYRYYMIEHISVHFAPCRQQMSVNSANNLVSQWQMPSFINTFPKFTEMPPDNNLTAANASIQYLSARRKPRMVTAYEPMSFGFDIENNLLTRQASPMLLTNGSVSGRELYSPGFLSTITAILCMATSDSPMGTALVTVRTRFAGLHRPDLSDPRDQVSTIVSNTKEESKEPQSAHQIQSEVQPDSVISELRRQLTRLESVKDS